MSNKAITTNDLKAVLDVVLPPQPSEYKKLLWTNPSPSSAFAEQTISLDLSSYDEVEVSFKHYYSGDTPHASARAKKNEIVVCTIPTYSNRSLPRRDFKATDTGVTFGYGSGFDDTYTWYAQNNNWGIPLNIYGIKYERVQPPVVDADAEVLAPKATLFRIGRIRILKLEKFKISDGLTISADDRPQSTQTGTATRIWSDSETYGAVALLYVNTDGSVAASYWGTYNNSSGASIATGDDRITGTVMWYVA